ncbi:Ig-like domain-containing protein [Streptomyces sp. LN785]|uniref:Ig-like domain-containing protein n=1 Tax=Streptomyces sp. LN785 TaxID=3112983 RepID=UPI003714CB4F
MNHLLCRGRAVGAEPSQGVVYAGLYSSADPQEGVVPGDHVQLGLSVAPGEGAPRGCAYLMESSLAGAEILAVQGLEYFPGQRWFRVRADLGETRTGVVSLRIGRPERVPRLRPQIMIGVPDGTALKMIRTGRLSDASLPVRAASAPGLRMVTEPGTQGAANVLDAAPAGSFAISVSQPRHGSTQLSRDGWATYLPTPGFTGYDRFEYTVGTADSAKITAPVNVFVGDPGHAPGAFPQHAVATGFHPWQWPELTGEMPWPGPHESMRSR